MNFEQAQLAAQESTEKASMMFNRIMLANYDKAQKDILDEIRIFYGKYLSVMKGKGDPGDIYNIVIQSDRLNKLLADVQKIYSYYYARVSKDIETGASAAMTDTYYKTQYVLEWFTPPGITFATNFLDPRVVELSVTGSIAKWNEITKDISRKVKNGLMKGVDLKDLVPQYGTLSDLLYRNRIDDLTKVQQVITQGFIQGKSITQMSTSIRDFIDTSKFNADRIAITEQGRVSGVSELMASKEAQAAGVDMKRQWYASRDGRTRDAHISLDGQRVGVDEPFTLGTMSAMVKGGWPKASMNIRCFTGDTNVVSESDIDKIYKRYYLGKIYVINTASGAEFSVTPNHPILTPTGWVKVEALYKGGEVIKIDYRNRFIGIKPDINNRPVMFDEIFNFFNIRFSFKRTTTIKSDFHGDGVVNSNVDIVFVNGRLLFSIKSFFNKAIKKINFAFSYSIQALFGRGRVFQKLNFIKSFPAHRFVGFFNLVVSLFLRHVLPFQKFRFTLISRLKSFFFKPSIYGDAGDAKGFRKFVDRNSRYMSPDKIIDINVCDFSGHVFNLENKDNVYLINGSKKVNDYFVVAHNCRCSVIDIIDDEDPKIMRARKNPLDPNDKRYDVMEFKSYKEWAAGKGLQFDKDGLLIRDPKAYFD